MTLAVLIAASVLSLVALLLLTTRWWRKCVTPKFFCNRCSRRNTGCPQWLTEKHATSIINTVRDAKRRDHQIKLDLAA